MSAQLKSQVSALAQESYRALCHWVRDLHRSHHGGGAPPNAPTSKAIRSWTEFDSASNSRGTFYDKALLIPVPAYPNMWVELGWGTVWVYGGGAAPARLPVGLWLGTKLWWVALRGWLLWRADCHVAPERDLRKIVNTASCAPPTYSGPTGYGSCPRCGVSFPSAATVCDNCGVNLGLAWDKAKREREARSYY